MEGPAVQSVSQGQDIPKVLLDDICEPAQCVAVQRALGFCSLPAKNVASPFRTPICPFKLVGGCSSLFFPSSSRLSVSAVW
jgi:hypothetical protein